MNKTKQIIPLTKQKIKKLKVPSSVSFDGKLSNEVRGTGSCEKILLRFFIGLITDGIGCTLKVRT